jgi:hypothetical protein
MKTGIMLDYNVILGHLVEDNEREFFYFLESHPNLGKMTRRVFDNTRHLIRKKGRWIARENPRSRRYGETRAEYEKLPQYIEIQESNDMKKQELVIDINKFYVNTVHKERRKMPIDIGTVTWRYKELIKQVSMNSAPLGELEYLEQKIAFSNPEAEDKFLLAEAILMPCKRKYIATNDGHFLDEFISKKIEAPSRNNGRIEALTFI